MIAATPGETTVSFQCQKCGRLRDDEWAAENEWLCSRQCGGTLQPVAVTVPAQVAPFVCDTSRLPYPVAITAQRFIDARDSSSDVFRTVNRLKDCFEATIKFLGAVLLADYFRSSAATPERNALLLEKLVRPSLGVWVRVVVGDVSRWLIDAKVEGPVGREVAALFFHPLAPRSAKPKPTQLMDCCEQFVTYRNEAIGHGAMRTDAAYERDLQDWLPMLRELLNGVERLAGCRLQLVTSRASSSLWMGTESGTTTETGAFDESLDGHFVLCHATDIETGGQAQPVTDLFPFLCYLPDREQQSRLHFYESIRRYQETRKEVDVLEYDTGFKCVRPEPIVGLERLLTPELLAKAFKTHQGRMEIIEGRVAGFGELLFEHTNLVGRKFVINAVKQFIDDNDRGLLVIEAEPGKGKTALMCHLIEEVFGHYSPQPIHFFYRRTAGITDPDVCVRTVYHALLTSHELAEGDDWRQETSPEKMLGKLNDLLSKKIAPKLSPSRPQLIFIDALDEAERTETGKDAIQRIPEALPKGVYVIVTTRKIQNRARLSRRSHVHWYDLDSPDLLQDNLRDGTALVRRELKECAVPNETVKEIARVGAGNFLVLTQSVNRVRESGDPGRATELLQRIAAEPASGHLGLIYEEFWERMSARLELHETQILCDVAGLLVTARSPLSAEMLCDCLRMSSAVWDFAIRHLVEYLTVVEVEEDGERETFYRVYHESFAEFLRAKVSPDRRRLASVLADYCRNWNEHAPGRGRLYSLRFGPEYLLHAAEHDPRRWNHLEDLLTDIFFLEAKAQAGFVFELANDLSSAWQSMPSDHPTRTILRLLDEAIRRDIHFIAEHAEDYPQGLFQCVWNVAWWYGNPEAAPYYWCDEEDDIQNDSVDEVDYPDPPGLHEVGGTLSQLLECWLKEKEVVEPGFHWLRSLRPPAVHLGTGIISVIPKCEWAEYSANGEWLLIRRTQSLVIWNAETRQQTAVMPEWEGPERRFPLVDAISPDGSQVVMASDVVLDYRGEMPVDDESLDDEDDEDLDDEDWEDEVRMMQELETGTEEETESRNTRPLLLVWNTRSNEVRAVNQTHKHEISKVAFSPDGSRFATASWDRTVRIWDARTLEELLLLEGSQRRVQSLSFSPDGARIVAAADVVRLWDTISGREIHVYRNVKITTALYDDSTPCFVRFSPDGKRIATNLGGSSIVILDAVNGEVVVHTHEIGTAITGMWFSQDGARLLASSKESSLIVDANTGATIQEIIGLESGAAPIDFSPDRNEVLCSDGTQIQIWDANRIWDAGRRSTEGALVGHDSDIGETRFIDGGEKLWTTSGSLIWIWESRSGIPLMPIELDPSPIRLMYSLNDKCCIQFREQNASLLRLFDMNSGEILFHARWEHEE